MNFSSKNILLSIGTVHNLLNLHIAYVKLVQQWRFSFTATGLQELLNKKLNFNDVSSMNYALQEVYIKG